MVGLAIIMVILGCLGIMSLIRIIGGGGLFFFIAVLYILGFFIVADRFGHEGFRASTGVIIVGSVGIIVGIIVTIVEAPWVESIRSSSDERRRAAQNAWSESRTNDPHTCSNCYEYIRGECKLSPSNRIAKSPEDSCSKWN